MPNPNYNQTITVYNCLKAKDSPDRKETWWRKVLHGCSWTEARTVQQRERTDETLKDNTVIRIPENEDYRDYETWKDDQSLYFTLNQGDIVVRGECSDEITGTTPNTAAEFLQNHDAVRIKATKDNSAFLFGKHYKVTT